MPSIGLINNSILYTLSHIWFGVLVAVLFAIVCLDMQRLRKLNVVDVFVMEIENVSVDIYIYSSMVGS